MGYLSDCNNVYLGGSGGAGGDYSDSNSACASCVTGEQYYQNNGYTLGGSCANAPNIQDGNGYVSDCQNFYYESSPSPMDSLSAQQACQQGTCQSYSQIIQGEGYDLSGTCSQENFSFQTSTSTKKVLYGALILFLLAVIAYYIHTKYYSGVRLSMCGMN